MGEREGGDGAHRDGPPPRFVPATFTPGRYTNVLLRTTRAIHAMQQVQEELTSSFALELAPDGAATLCRNWRYLATNRGPQVRTEERIREQFGYRGRWHQAEDAVRVTLERDDSVCPRVEEYLELVPRHEDRWELVCRPVTAVDLPGVDAPMLLCASPFESPRFGEDEPHLVGGVRLGTGGVGGDSAGDATGDAAGDAADDAAGDAGGDPGGAAAARAAGDSPRYWIVLAAPPGVRIEVERTSISASGEERVRMRGGGP